MTKNQWKIVEITRDFKTIYALNRLKTSKFPGRMFGLDFGSLWG